jgi:glycine/D-amino acid oxidase-like deaminating enzyme
MDTITRNTNTPKSVAIIGSGWSGCHTALELSSTNQYTVTILEKPTDIFAGVSGQFGIRIHRGPHYPRSSGTRESCRRSFDRFTEKYRDLVVPVDPAVYSLARYDSMGKESKVNARAFGEVCGETAHCPAADLAEFVRAEKSGESQVECAFKLDEPCALLNPYLKTYFRERLGDAGVGIRVNSEVISVHRLGDGSGRQCITTADGSHEFYDAVINATGYESALPDGLLSNLPIKADIRYQACIALHYRDTKMPTDPAVKPLSFIVMDG